MNQHKKTPFLSLQAIIITLLFMVPTTIAIQPSSQTTAIITQTISIDQPQLTSKIINNQPYTHVTLDDGYSIFQPGQPDLPAHGLTLLLPPNHQVSNIEITCDEPISLGVNHQITSVPEPIPLLDTHFQTPEQATPIFSTDKLYFPDSSYEIIGTYHFRGYTLLVLNLYPVTYHIITGELTYTPKICLTIHTQETTKTHPFYRGLSRDYTAVNNKISNPIQLNTYPSPSIHPQGILDYDLLIITIREFKPAFEVLKTAHEQRGRSVRIKTLNEIGLIPENVTPEDIREFITDEYLNYNIDYVLIGGDADIIPAQTLFVSAWTGGTSTYMPSDLYYACLDGTYNYDDDNKNGEPTDGPNGGDVDLVAEIYVGRASVGSIDEADNFISKTITYMETGGYDSGTVLLVGEHLWEGPDTWGGDYMDELIDHVNANAMITEGIPSTTYTINRLYDKTWNGNDWPTSEIMDRLTNGVHIVNHLGHSSYGYNMKMVNSQVSTLSNTNLFFLYSQGCMAGGFDDPDGYDSIAEYFTIKTPNAAFAAIMNARYGWGVIGSTDGASQRFHRQFWDAIYGEHIDEIGKANQDSKEDNLHRISGSCMRWCYYQLNLFGDPTLTFTDQNDNTPPDSPSRPWGVKIGAAHDECTFFTHAIDTDNDSLYYKWDWGDGTMSNWVGPYESGEEMYISHSYERPGRFVLRVKCRDNYRDESDWSLPYPIFMPAQNSFPLPAWIQYIITQFLSKLFT